MSTPVWPDDRVRALLALWADGLGPAEIGRRLGVTKNAVVGKTQRLGLAPHRALPQRQGQKLAKPVPMDGAAGLAEAKRRSLPRKAPPCPAPAPVVAPTPVPAVGSTCACCWPLGEPGTRSFRFCEAPSELGHVYCPEHARRAYVRVREVAA